MFQKKVAFTDDKGFSPGGRGAYVEWSLRGIFVVMLLGVLAIGGNWIVDKVQSPTPVPIQAHIGIPRAIIQGVEIRALGTPVSGEGIINVKVTR